MSAAASRVDPEVIGLILFSFTAVGIMTSVALELGRITTWVWLGIGVSVMYLLYKVALAVEHIAYDS